MSKHTPGPWNAADKRPRSQGFSIFADGQYVAFVGDSDAVTPCEDNARLIAAAPDLLAVCQELEESVEYWSEYDVPLGIVDRIRAAIAKATGGQP
jgi:hypothetical protein